MGRLSRSSPEVRERAIRLVDEQTGEHGSHSSPRCGRWPRSSAATSKRCAGGRVKPSGTPADTRA